MDLMLLLLLMLPQLMLFVHVGQHRVGEAIFHNINFVVIMIIIRLGVKASIVIILTWIRVARVEQVVSMRVA